MAEASRYVVLRDYQRDAILAIEELLEQDRRRLLVPAPTGSGKTEMAVAIWQEFCVGQGRSMLFVAERTALVAQAAERFLRYGVTPKVAMGKQAVPEPLRHLYLSEGAQLPLSGPVIGSRDTLRNRGWLWSAGKEAELRSTAMRTQTPKATKALERYKERRALVSFDWVVIDEAHVQQIPPDALILDGAVVLGLSATPYTQVVAKMGYEAVVPTLPTGEMVDRGYLVPMRFWEPERTPTIAVSALDDHAARDLAASARAVGVEIASDDLASAGVPVGSKKGTEIVDEYRKGELSKRVRLYTGKLVETFGVICEHEFTIDGEVRYDVPAFVYAASQPDALAIVRALNDTYGGMGHPVRAELMTSKVSDGERNARRRRFEDGETTCWVTVDVLTRGVDAPKVRLIVDAHPRKSAWWNAEQVYGRGRRIEADPHPVFGPKRYCVVADHADNYSRHSDQLLTHWVYGPTEATMWRERTDEEREIVSDAEATEWLASLPPPEPDPEPAVGTCPECGADIVRGKCEGGCPMPAVGRIDTPRNMERVAGHLVAPDLDGASERVLVQGKEMRPDQVEGFKRILAMRGDVFPPADSDEEMFGLMLYGPGARNPHRIRHWWRELHGLSEVPVVQRKGDTYVLKVAGRTIWPADIDPDDWRLKAADNWAKRRDRKWGESQRAAAAERRTEALRQLDDWPDGHDECATCYRGRLVKAADKRAEGKKYRQDVTPEMLAHVAVLRERCERDECPQASEMRRLGALIVKGFTEQVATVPCPEMFPEGEGDDLAMRRYRGNLEATAREAQLDAWHEGGAPMERYVKQEIERLHPGEGLT